MSVRRGRLQRIEVSLTPTQAAVLWLQEAHRFESMQAYVEWLAGQPFTAYPLHRLRDLVVPAVEQAMKGADREACDQAIRAAVREVAFLFFVHQQANARILSDWRAWHFGVALLTHDPAQAGGAAPQGQERDLRHEQWREHAANTLRELCALTEAMRVLGDRYFGGHAVPFPQAAEGLAFCVGTAERLIENHNDDMRFAGRRKSRARLTDELIDVKAITAGAPAVATLPVTEIVALAKSEVHSLMGEQDAAADAVLPLGRARQRMKRHLGGRRAVSRGYGWPCRARRPPVPHAHYSPIVSMPGKSRRADQAFSSSRRARMRSVSGRMPRSRVIASASSWSCSARARPTPPPYSGCRPARSLGASPPPPKRRAWAADSAGIAAGSGWRCA